MSAGFFLKEIILFPENNQGEIKIQNKNKNYQPILESI